MKWRGSDRARRAFWAARNRAPKNEAKPGVPVPILMITDTEKWILLVEEHNERRSNEMAVSRDRVEFIPKLSTGDNGATNAALVEAMGFTPDQAWSAIHSEATIRCRPSQFARFIIARERKAGCNGIKNLNARLIVVEDQKPKFIDASRSPNTMLAEPVSE